MRKQRRAWSVNSGYHEAAASFAAVSRRRANNKMLSYNKVCDVICKRACSACMARATTTTQHPRRLRNAGNHMLSQWPGQRLAGAHLASNRPILTKDLSDFLWGSIYKVLFNWSNSSQWYWRYSQHMYLPNTAVCLLVSHDSA